MMREFKFFSLLFCAGFAPGQAEHASATVRADVLYMTVPEVIERVKGQNLELLIRKEGVRRALEQSYQRRAALLPQIGFSASQTRTQLARGFISEQFDSPPFNSFGSRVVGSIHLIDAQHFADWRIAKLEHAIEALDYEVALQDVLDQVIMLYFTHLRNLRQVEIYEGNLAREERLFELAEAQFAAGVAVKIEVTRAAVRRAAVQRDLMEARTEADDSILQLKALLDIDLSRELTLDRSIVDEIKSPPALENYGKMLDLMEVRPELESQQKLLDRAILAKRAVNWQRLPTIGLFAEWGYDTNEAFDGDEGEAWLAGIQASMPIWEGGRIAAERREAKAAIRQNRRAIRQLELQIQREFQFALLEMRSRYSQIEFARNEVRLGMDEVEQARERYQEGLADNTELIDAQQRLADAERSQLRAIYLYGLSRLAFARAIGSVERVLD